MRTFRKLKPILLSLNKKEVSQLYAGISTSGNSKTVNLRKKLVDFLLLRNRSYNSLLKEFESLNERKLNSELNRIYEILKESMILKATLESEIKDSDFFLVKFKLLKEIPLVMILGKKGHIRESRSIIKRNIKKSTEFELLEEKTLYMQMLLDIEYHQLSPEEVIKRTDSIKDIERALFSFRSVLQKYEYFMSLTIHKSNANLKGLINEIVQYAYEQYGKTKLKRTLFYYYLLEMEKALVHSEFTKGNEFGLRILELLESSAFLYSKKRLGSVYSYLSHNELCCLNLDESIEYERKASSYLTATSLDNISLKEFSFLSHFYNNSIDKAVEELDQVIKIQTIVEYPFYQSKFNYYRAIIYFLEMDYEKAWKEFSLHFDLEKDKEGWRVWLSIMRMLCQIERKELVDLDLMVQTFRKYIKSWEERSEIREREKLVFKVIETLNKQHLDFTLTKEIEADTLTLLRSKVSQLKWRPNSPELIIFHDWFDSKCENRPYTPNYLPYRSKAKAVN